MEILLEIHTPISATPSFLRQWWAQARSFQVHGGEIAKQAHFHAWVSQDTEQRDLTQECTWLKDPAFHVHWVDKELFREHWYYGTGIARGGYEGVAPWTLYLDADVLVTGELDSLFASLAENPEIRGFPAHLDCFALDPDAWTRLYATAGLSAPKNEQLASGSGILYSELAQAAPLYWNFGVLVGPSVLMARMGKGLRRELEWVNQYWSSVFRCQQAVSLAIHRQELPHSALDVRYNFPNYSQFSEKYPDQLRETRLLHYLGRDAFVNKDRDFASTESYQKLLQRDGTGVNAFFIEKLCALGPYPMDRRWPRLRRFWQRQQGGMNNNG